MLSGKRWAAGLFTAVLLLPVPTMAIQAKIAKAAGRETIRQQESAIDIVNQQTQERREYVAFSRSLRAEFRRSGPVTQASVNRYLRNLLLELRSHWRAETRTSVASPFNFPTL